MTAKSKRAQIRLHTGRARPIWLGHPWVYSRAIDSMEGPSPAPGDLVDVLDAGGQIIGVGTYNPQARIAVRMLDNDVNSLPLAQWIQGRVDRARQLRSRIMLPSSETNAFRLINGEGDGLPGIICDQLGDLFSLQVTTAAADQWLPLVLDALDATRAKVSVPEDAANFESIAPGDRFGRGDQEEFAEFQENGISWRLKPGKGQKTGFYTDQRVNRRLLRTLAAGSRVLDCFCYTGGFALNAARGGATSVIGVDSSGPAISVAAGTAESNGIDNARFFKEDVLRYLKGVGEERFDCVVLDPPKLVRKRQHIEDGLRKYSAINAAGIEHVSPGGLLMTCSCSGLVDNETFLRMLSESAHRAGRRITLMEIRSAGPDHPVPLALEEARYLTVVVCRIN
jgi:23S rRNA (cytosine1962-C5)-methyltransferase